MKIHEHNHSFIDFASKFKEGEYCICKYTPEHLEMLDMHLFPSEVYECDFVYDIK